MCVVPFKTKFTIGNFKENDQLRPLTNATNDPCCLVTLPIKATLSFAFSTGATEFHSAEWHSAITNSSSRKIGL
jgi:hypothetical protein